ncbi:MAG: type II toxin-antitoxin system RelE/ParE family toxin [Candidatus Heimdallarchaeota archaeon]
MERYKLEVTGSFERDFRKLDPQLKQRLDSAIRTLETDPHLGKLLRGELSSKRSLRIGDYRVIYVIDEEKNTVTLYSVRHRKVAYR